MRRKRRGTKFDFARTVQLREECRVRDVTRILQALADGDPKAGDELISIVYEELRRIAAQKMAVGGGGQTLQPTELVHEVWLRLGGEQLRGWQNRAHFFASAATAMRSILVDRARRRKAVRHGGGQQRVDIDVVELADQTLNDDQVLAVHDALEKLAEEDPRKAEIVKLRYFAGLSVEEAAQALGVSEPTAKRWWAYARAWLGREMKL
jgi:RNA polymerase sigma factor (TIGR02999 family)